MKYLLDTHAFLWFVLDDKRIKLIEEIFAISREINSNKPGKPQ